MSALQRAAIAWRTLETAGVPGVRNVYVLPGTNGTTIAVQIRKVNEGHPNGSLPPCGAAAPPCTGTGTSSSWTRTSTSRTTPRSTGRSRIASAPAPTTSSSLPGSFGSPIDPSTPLAERSVTQLGSGLWNRVLIDATKTWRYTPQPEWGGQRFPPTVENAPEDLATVRRRWNDYGFTGWDGEPRG